MKKKKKESPPEPRYCENCGAAVGDNDEVCPSCGTPVEPPASAAEDKTDGGKKKRGRKAVIIIALIVVLAVIIGIAVSLFTGTSGYKSTVSKMCTALKDYDVEDMQDLFSDTYYLLYGDEDTIKQDMNDILDVMEDEVGIIKRISFEVIDENDYSTRRLQNVLGIGDDTENDEVDLSDIKMAVSTELILTVKGTNNTDTFKLEVLLVREKGIGWRILSWDFG